MFDESFKRNLEGLQKAIDVLGRDINKSNSKELLGNALKEYRLWIQMFLDYKDRLSEKPRESKQEIYSKIIQVMKNTNMPLKYIKRFKNELKKHRWDNYMKGKSSENEHARFSLKKEYMKEKGVK